MIVNAILSIYSLEVLPSVRCILHYIRDSPEIATIFKILKHTHLLVSE